MTHRDAFSARSTLETSAGPVRYYRLSALEEAGLGDVSRLPFTIRILLEAALRNLDDFAVTEDHVRAIAGWRPGGLVNLEFDLVGKYVVRALERGIGQPGGAPSRDNPEQ